jgi:hypothetical protein
MESNLDGLGLAAKEKQDESYRTITFSRAVRIFAISQ